MIFKAVTLKCVIHGQVLSCQFLYLVHDKICTEIESKHLETLIAISYLLNVILKLGLLFCISFN